MRLVFERLQLRSFVSIGALLITEPTPPVCLQRRPRFCFSSHIFTKARFCFLGGIHGDVEPIGRVCSFFFSRNSFIGIFLREGRFRCLWYRRGIERQNILLAERPQRDPFVFSRLRVPDRHFEYGLRWHHSAHVRCLPLMKPLRVPPEIARRYLPPYGNRNIEKGVFVPQEKDGNGRRRVRFRSTRGTCLRRRKSKERHMSGIGIDQKGFFANSPKQPLRSIDRKRSHRLAWGAFADDTPPTPYDALV
mmetsp:Transcript_25733/g.64823  ORF Transcript_25733/g.64823 Transcript_25733/m.64823 type:complete len:248 (+) Transcript_25733:580-1323(+)